MSAPQYAVGLDLGGTAIKYGICSAKGEILHESQCPTQADQPAEVILNDLLTAAREAIDIAQKNGTPISAIGMGTPGSVNVESGTLMGNTPNFKLWKNVKIKPWLESRLNLPVWIDNDANMMAFGEARYGAGDGASNVACITLGTGIGGGIVIDNKLFRGSNYAGSELGHMSIRYDGVRCRCGGIGCWEMYASATAMIENYNRLKPNEEIESTITIFQRYNAGEPEATRVIDEEIQIVSIGVANMLNIFNPQVIIIGGGVSEAGDWFVEAIAEKALPLAMASATANVRIVRARLGNKAGLLGAAAFALSRL